TPSSHGNGGNSATSTLSTASPAMPTTPFTRSTASPPSTGFIFQLAARSAFTLGDAAGNYASFRTATPGSSLPSRYSRVAPPPLPLGPHSACPAIPGAAVAIACLAFEPQRLAAGGRGPPPSWLGLRPVPVFGLWVGSVVVAPWWWGRDELV